MKKKPALRALERRATASVEIVANLRSLSKIRGAIETHAGTLGIGRSKFYRVMLAVEEAVSNVIRHVCKKSAKKSVSIRIETTRNEVRILIRDVGNDFDFETYPSGALVKAALKTRSRGGYGIHLIKSIMDKYEYVCGKNGETNLRLVKSL